MGVSRRGVPGTEYLVFALVAAGMTNLYITQPVLPVLAAEFGLDELGASLSVSLAILGITLANLPFGMLADRLPLRPIILTGGAVVAAAGLVCAFTPSYPVLVAARFVQGLCMPALTTCVAAYLANSLPVARLNVVMGAYVAATVVGGLGGRLLGGWLHPPLHWRYAFVSAALLLLLAVVAAARWLPGVRSLPPRHGHQAGFGGLLTAWPVLRIYMVAFCAFFAFSAVFNFLPFYLSAPPIGASTGLITLLYLAYLVGAVMGPLAGRLANRVGSGTTLVLGALAFALALLATWLPSLPAILVGLMGVCAGFFATHAAAAGALNARLTGSRGRGNALYVLFYYAGGAVGIMAGGYAYRHGGWPALLGLSLAVLAVPLLVGVQEMREARRRPPVPPAN